MLLIIIPYYYKSYEYDINNSIWIKLLLNLFLTREKDN